MIVVIIGDGGKSGDHPGTKDDPAAGQLSSLVAPLRNPEVNPVLNPLTGADLGRSDLTSDDDSAALEVRGHPTAGQHRAISQRWDFR